MIAPQSKELDPGQLFRSSFTGQEHDLFISCLKKAIETAREAHYPESGGNETTFGLGLYHYVVHELQIALQRNRDLRIEVKWVNQAFRLCVGPYDVACHRVGSSAGENIWSCFPNPGASHGLVLDKGRHQWLPGFEPSLVDLRAVVISYMCNVETGLEAVYLCIPTKQKGARITEWGYAEQIWAREDELAATPSAERPVPRILPAEEHVDEPVVALKPRRETDS